MEAIIVKKEIVVHYTYKVDSVDIQVEYRYRNSIDYEQLCPCALFIHHEGELTDNLIKSIIDSYFGEYPVYHTFKTDKWYISNITRYMMELFGVKNEEVNNA